MIAHVEGLKKKLKERFETSTTRIKLNAVPCGMTRMNIRLIFRVSEM